MTADDVAKVPATPGRLATADVSSETTRPFRVVSEASPKEGPDATDPASSEPLPAGSIVADLLSGEWQPADPVGSNPGPGGPMPADSVASDLAWSDSPTGPIASGLVPDEPVPTGPIVGAPVAPRSEPPTRVQTALQAAVVFLAALAAGLVVFITVRSVADDGPDVANREDGEDLEDREDRLDVPIVDPGPGDPGRSEDAPRSERALADADADGDGDGEHDGDLDGAGTSSGGSDGTGPEGLPGAVEQDRSNGATNAAPAPGDSAPGSTAVPDSGSGDAELGPDATAPTARGSTTTPASGPIIASPSLPATTTTVISEPPETTPLPLIASPASGSVATWESAVTFTANPVPGATQYCWQITGPAGAHPNNCRSSLSYVLASRLQQPGAGPMTVTAEATDSRGRVLATQQISLTLLARDVIVTPREGADLGLGLVLQFEAREIPNATRYCWRLVQGSTSTTETCRSGPTATMINPGSLLAGFSEGEVSVRVRVEADGVEIGRHSVTAQLLLA